MITILVLVILVGAVIIGVADVLVNSGDALFLLRFSPMARPAHSSIRPSTSTSVLS